MVHPRLSILFEERRVGEFVRACVGNGAVRSVHDISDGGLLVAVAEMCLAGNCGAFLYNGPWEKLGSTSAFAEDQGLYVVTTMLHRDEFSAMCAEANIPAMMLGRAGGEAPDASKRLVIDYQEIGRDTGGDIVIPLADLRAVHEGFFPRLMGSELTPEF